MPKYDEICEDVKHSSVRATSSGTRTAREIKIKGEDAGYLLDLARDLHGEEAVAGVSQAFEYPGDNEARDEALRALVRFYWRAWGLSKVIKQVLSEKGGEA